MTEKEKMVALLNYCFDNNIEPWNNQENIKTVESFIISTRGLARKTDSIDIVSNAERTFCTCGNPSGEGNIKMINNEYLLYFCSDCGKQVQNDC